MDFVAGVDSSTQSVKIQIHEANSGKLVRQGRATHPEGTEVHPEKWRVALQEAIDDAGGIADVSAISIAGQQHGLVALDSSGEVLRPALLWNDTRSAEAAADLNREFGGEQAMADAVGSVLVASFTAAKVRWVSDHEPAIAQEIAGLALPHDWLSWKLAGGTDIGEIFTDRSDASGTGYFDSVTNQYRHDLLALALRSDRTISLPRIIDPHDFGGKTTGGILIAAGAGDNAAAALGISAEPGDVVVSLGTSGTAFAVSATPTHDSQGEIAGFADATGIFLPLVCTLNAARIMDAASRILGVNLDEVGALALQAQPGAHGLTLLPYFEGERTPNRPNAQGVLSGMTLSNATPANIARAMVEGMLGGLADAVHSLRNAGVAINRIILIGGAAKNIAVGPIASSLFGAEVLLPEPGEYVARGAARQAAWALSGSAAPTAWNSGDMQRYLEEPTPEVMVRYRNLREQTLGW